jgi:hypothetical protein
MVPVGSCTKEKTANWLEPPPEGSTETTTWLVLLSEMGHKISTGMSL